MNALVLLLAETLQGELVITQERLEALGEDVRPLVEKAAGRTFRKPPALGISTAEEVAKVLAGELVPQFRAQVPGTSHDEAREAAGRMATLYAGILLGKYQPAGHRIHIVAENFRKLADLMKRPRIATPEHLRAVVIHELVHALDEQDYRATSRLGEAKTADEIVILNALVEGHAQHVLRRVLEAEQAHAVFREFEESTTAELPGLSEGEKVLSQLLTASLRFAYVDGRLFFDRLAAAGRKTTVGEVFRAPPASKDVLLHPERYADPKAAPAARDLQALFDAVARDHEGWRSQRIKTGEFELRAAFGDFVEKKRLDPVLPRAAGGMTLALSRRDQMRAFAVIQMDTPENASRLAELLGALTRSKEARLKEGKIRITKCDRKELKTKGGLKNECTRMTVDADGEEVLVADAIAVLDEFVIEVLYSNCEAADEELAGHLDRIRAYLKEGK